MFSFFPCIYINVLCIFFNFLLSATLENYTSSLDYETFFENDSYTVLHTNHSQWYNISEMNKTVVNVTDAESNEFGNLPYWHWHDLSYTTSNENICICDLYYNVCDINCCCDLDCSEDDMKVFSSCNSQVTMEENYCYLTDIILRNNTVYQIQQNPNNGLLCIVHNNLKQYLRFKDVPILKSHIDLDVLLNYQSKKIYSWDDSHVKESKKQDIKSGRPIPITISERESVWNLPHSCFGEACNCKRKVLYLENYNSTCTITINNLKNECESNDALAGNNYINFCLRFQRRLSNNLFPHSKSNELFSDKFCFTEIAEKPTYQSNICSNVVREIHFTVLHSGIFGIQEIIPTFKFYKLSSNNSIVTQHFSIDFKWYNSTEIIAKKSGNPGYQVGLPIVTGTNSSDAFKIKIQSEGLSVFSKDSSSQCKGRKSIKFGKNFKTNCYLKVNIINNCKDVQEKIYDVLLGSSRDGNLFIGMFGNANESNREEWIEAYHVEEYEFPNVDGVCHLTTGLKINVVYAAVGTVQNPQFKILGLGYRYINFANFSNGEQLIILSASVSFFDVTEPVMPHYPKAPSLKVNLPSDFFYPFLQGS